MHIDYAKEIIEYSREQAKKWDWAIDPDRHSLNLMIEKDEKKLLKFFIENGNEKTISITQTIIDKAENQYFRITEKMKFCIVSDILSKFSIEEVIKVYE